MKKRLLALILAGILTASLSSCISVGKRPEQTGNNPGTEPQQTQQNTTGNVGLQYTDVDESVYVTASNLNLRQNTTSTVGAVQVPQFTKLHRVKYSQTWSVVEYEGQTYYAASEYLTNEDLMAENFTACADTVMYAASTLNLRKYPSPEAYSDNLGSIEINTPVTVVARSNNTAWVKIKNPLPDATEPFVFVNSKWLSATTVSSSTVDVEALKFQKCEPERTMYVTGDQLKLRKEPSMNGTEIDTLVKGDVVTVIAISTVADADDILWARISVADAVQPGDPQTYSFGYASMKYLSTTPVGATVTLEDMLEQYLNFTAREMDVYAVGGYNVRTSPILSENNDNLSSISLAQKDPVKVVARANEADADGVLWYMIRCKDTENKDLFLFVSGKALTPDPDGNAAPLLLEDLLNQYSDFTAEESTKVVTGSAGANCYSAPSTSGTKAMTLAKDTVVTVVAKGAANGTEWYVIRTESGLFYFAGASLFGDAAN